MEGLLAVVGLEVTTKGIRTDTGIRRDRGGEFQVLGAATLKLRAPSKCSADKRSREEISVGESEGTSGMTGMQG